MCKLLALSYLTPGLQFEASQDRINTIKNATSTEQLVVREKYTHVYKAWGR